MSTTRQWRAQWALAACVGLMASAGAGAVLYVAPGGTNSAPYDSWSAAATNLKTAVDLANTYKNGSTVWVSNSVYTLTTQVVISNTIVRGYGGDRTAVVIDGAATTRLFYLNHTNAVLADLTVSNGLAADTNLNGNGGGVYLNQTGALLSNCVVTACTATNSGGGVYANKGITRDCLVAQNVAQGSGSVTASAAGGLHVGELAVHCTISNNQALAGLNAVGGVYLYNAAAISNSTIVGNLGRHAGGAKNYTNVKLVNCDIRDNVASNGTDICGGGIYADKSAIVRNCLIRGNVAYHTNTSNPAGGGVRTAMSSSDVFELQACTVASNRTVNVNTGAGGAYLNGTNVLTDCVFYGNKSGFDPTWDTYNFVTKSCTNLAFNNCAERPLQLLPAIQGNITNSPLFQDAVQGDFHLMADSPCINTGTNMSWMTGALDLDGNVRLDRKSGIADMGCYEHAPLGAWGTIIIMK